MNIMFFLTPKRDVDCVFEEDTLGQALSRMEGHQFTSIPIINGHTGAYIGTISEGDILREIKKKDSLSMRFEEDKPVMSLKRKYNYRAVRADADIEDLFDCATSQNFVPVVDDTGVLIGIITRKSILNFLIRSYNKCCDQMKISSVSGRCFLYNKSAGYALALRTRRILLHRSLYR